MKILKLSFFAALVLSMSLFTGCKDDETADVSAFVGNYTITKAAILSITPAIVTNEIGPVPIPPGTDITAIIHQSLLSQVDCSSADKSWVELRENMSMYMSCEGANELNAGTWEEVSPTELKLNMNAAAIPSSPTGFSLTVSNIAVAGNNMSGDTSVPLPKDMVAALVAEIGAGLGMELTLAESNPDVFMLAFSITFVKQ